MSPYRPPDSETTFLQIYLMDGTDQVERRCMITDGLRPEISFRCSGNITD